MPRILSSLHNMEKTPWPFQFVTKISKSRCKQFIFYLCFILWNLFLEILGRAHRHPDFLDFLSWIWCQCESDEVHSLSHPEQVFGPPPTSPAENPVCLFFIDISSVDHHFCWSKDKSKDRGLWDILYNRIWLGYFGMENTGYNTPICEVYSHSQFLIWKEENTT